MSPCEPAFSPSLLVRERSGRRGVETRFDMFRGPQRGFFVPPVPSTSFVLLVADLTVVYFRIEVNDFIRAIRSCGIASMPFFA